MPPAVLVCMNIINVAFNLAALATLLGILSLVVNAVRCHRHRINHDWSSLMNKLTDPNFEVDGNLDAIWERPRLLLDFEDDFFFEDSDEDEDE